MGNKITGLQILISSCLWSVCRKVRSFKRNWMWNQLQV